jgi:hypothetical protein
MWLCGEASASKVNAPDVAMIREYAAATARLSEIDIAAYVANRARGDILTATDSVVH